MKIIDSLEYSEKQGCFHYASRFDREAYPIYLIIDKHVPQPICDKFTKYIYNKYKKINSAHISYKIIDKEYCEFLSKQMKYKKYEKYFS